MIASASRKFSMPVRPLWRLSACRGSLTARLLYLIKPKATGSNEMRKRIIAQGIQGIIFPVDDWLDLENSAQAETTSEDASHPIESALKPGVGSGGRASGPGQQTVRLLFDKPLRVTCDHPVFHEHEQQRTQEFLLRWFSDGSRSCREIVRQQYNFSLQDGTCDQRSSHAELGIGSRRRSLDEGLWKGMSAENDGSPGA